MSMISEFKDFAMKGNVVDLAVGVIIGAAFGKIVSSMVDGIIMPVVGMLVGGVNFGDLAYSLQDAVIGPDGKPVLVYYLRCVGSEAYLKLATEAIQRQRELRTH